MLRRLGARHQLASGFSGEGLADTARPVSPAGEEEDDEAAPEAHPGHPIPSSTSSQPELVDFDDGISAISSHTLEEMERRRTAKERSSTTTAAATTTVLRLHPLDFSQIIDEECEIRGQQSSTTNDDEDDYDGMRRELQGAFGGGRKKCHGLDVVEEEEVDETEVVFGAPFYEEKTMHRVPSTRTNQTINTSATEDTHEFEDMCLRHEALYWTDEDQVARIERSACRADVVARVQDRDQRSSARMSIEERARRLRELSRSRSRSDGSGSVS